MKASGGWRLRCGLGGWDELFGGKAGCGCGWWGQVRTEKGEGNFGVDEEDADEEGEDGEGGG